MENGPIEGKRSDSGHGDGNNTATLSSSGEEVTREMTPDSLDDDDGNNNDGDEALLGVLTGRIDLASVIAGVVAGIVILLLTANVLVALYCTAVIALIIGAVTGIAVLQGWTLGIIESVILISPMRVPSREPFTMCGVADMFSWPPATTTGQ